MHTPEGFPLDHWNHFHVCSLLTSDLGRVMIAITIHPNEDFRGQRYHYHAVTCGLNTTSLDKMFSLFERRFVKDSHPHRRKSVDQIAFSEAAYSYSMGCCNGSVYYN